MEEHIFIFVGTVIGLIGERFIRLSESPYCALDSKETASMPHANIWIRKQDYDKWEKIPNKSEFISQALRGEKLEAVYIEEEVNDKIAFDAFNGASTTVVSGMNIDSPSAGSPKITITGTLTCKDGHPSRDGKYCSNIKCSYFN